MRKADSALTGMVGNSIGHKPYAAFPGCLFHDGGLPDSRRSHKKNGTLSHQWKGITPLVVLLVICSDGIDNLCFCLFYIHSSSSCFSVFAGTISLYAQSGTISILADFSRNTKAVS